MNFYDSLSYFSDGFLDRLAEPAELGRQLHEHRDEPEYIAEAIVELAAYAQNRARYRKVHRAARTLAGETLFELVHALGDESGRVSYGRVMIELRRRHKMAGCRNGRVFDQLERAGALIVEHEHDELGIVPGGSVTVRLSPELRQPAASLIDDELAARMTAETSELVARMAADPWDLEAVAALTPADRDEFGHGLGDFDGGEAA